MDLYNLLQSYLINPETEKKKINDAILNLYKNKNHRQQPFSKIAVFGDSVKEH
jgi:hypothetical protein